MRDLSLAASAQRCLSEALGIPSDPIDGYRACVAAPDCAGMRALSESAAGEALGSDGSKYARGVMANARQLRAALVDKLASYGVLGDEAIADAFRTVPRERFVPDAANRNGLAAVYKDAPIPTKTDARGSAISSSSQPQIMAQMLHLLDLRAGARVLEIGTGTGYNAALLSHIVGNGGHVVSIELDPDLARLARDRLKTGGHRVRVVVGDGAKGHPPSAPFDRIIVTASTPTIPVAWRDQLGDAGQLVLPLRLSNRFSAQVVARLRRDGDRLVSTDVVPGGFMGMRSCHSDNNPVEPTRQVGIYEQIGDTSDYRSVDGPVVERMRPAVRRRLAALLADEPRVQTDVPRMNSWGFDAFLAVAAPKLAVRWRVDGQIIPAVVTPDGRSLAGLRQRRAMRARDRLLSLGHNDALEHLQSLIVRYCAGGGNVSQISIRATPSDGLQLRYGLRSTRR